MNYPSESWLTNWLANHPGKTKDDADCAWWDKEIDAGRPTPYDLQGEQAENAKKIVRKPANYSLVDKNRASANPTKRNAQS